LRIDRIDIDGYGSLSGSFLFPREGLGFWAAGNDTGKSRLVHALTAAFYGPSTPSGEIETGWIMVRLTLDDDRPLVVARDLTTDTLQITDAGGRDVSAEYRNGDDSAELGERLFHRGRDAFFAAIAVALEDLRSTVGDPHLIALLDGDPLASAPSAGEDEAPTGPPSPADPEATVVLSSDAPANDELQIVRSGGEPVSWSSEAGDRTAAGGSDPGSSAEELEGPEEALPSLEEIDDPAAAPSVRVRSLRAGLDVLEGQLGKGTERLHELAARCEEIRAEHDRLAGLAGAVPEDVEKLAQLLELMKRIQDKREKLAAEEAAFRTELGEQGRDTELLRELDDRFRDLDSEHREFLESYPDEETVRRGNQALVRSESRLDESRLEDIEQGRRRAARAAHVPLFAAALGLFGSIGIRLFPVLPVPANALLAVGLVGAVLGAVLLWRAKRREEPERQRIAADLARKSARLDEFDADAERAGTRLAQIAREHGIEEPESLLEQLEQWKQGQDELRDLDRFRRQAEEVDREIVKIREKLSSFQMEEGVGPDPSNFSAEELEALHRDYVRFFEVVEELEAADRAVSGTEDRLAAVESRREALRERIAEILILNGIDPEPDLEVAIERLARSGDSADSSGAGDSGTVDSGPAGGPKALPDPSAGPGDRAWIASVSARMEAILRRFLPDAREVEVDDRLRPSFRLDPRGSRLDWPELKRHLSTASLDQVCLSLRLAALEALAETGERLPVLLDDPLVRCDDSRYDRALDFLVTDASSRLQMVLLTAHEVRSRWFLHQYPQHRSRIFSLVETESAPEPASGSPVSSSPPSA
jgi:hypothetical protein